MKRLNLDTSYLPLVLFRLHCILRQWVWQATMTDMVKVHVTTLIWNEQPCLDSNLLWFGVDWLCYLSQPIDGFGKGRTRADRVSNADILTTTVDCKSRPRVLFKLHRVWRQWVRLSTMTDYVEVQVTPLFWNEQLRFARNSLLFQASDGCCLGKHGVAYVKCWACDAWQVTSYEPTTTVISIRRNSRPQNAIMLSEWTCWSDRSDHTLSICSPQLKRFVLQWYCPTIRLAREGLTDHASQHGRHTYLLLDCHY